MSRAIKKGEKSVNRSISSTKERTQEVTDVIRENNITGKGIFGKDFDKLLKRAGVKKEVFALGRKARPIINEGIEETAKALIQARPDLVVPITMASKSSQRYISAPTQYQKTGGVKKLIGRTIIDTIKEGPEIMGSGIQTSRSMPTTMKITGGVIAPKQHMTDIEKSRTSMNQIRYFDNMPPNIAYAEGNIKTAYRSRKRKSHPVPDSDDDDGGFYGGSFTTTGSKLIGGSFRIR